MQGIIGHGYNLRNKMTNEQLKKEYAELGESYIKTLEIFLEYHKKDAAISSSIKMSIDITKMRIERINKSKICTNQNQ